MSDQYRINPELFAIEQEEEQAEAEENQRRIVIKRIKLEDSLRRWQEKHGSKLGSAVFKALQTKAYRKQCREEQEEAEKKARFEEETTFSE